MYLASGGRLTRYDPSGKFSWQTPGTADSVPTPRHIDAFGGSTAMVVDSLTGDTFFQSQFNIVVYSQGLYSKTFPIPGAGVAISGARELYSINGATVHVLQLDGTPIKNLSFPQIQNSQGIAIGQDGTKYIIDVA